jgi:hypothetical protein
MTRGLRAGAALLASALLALSSPLGVPAPASAQPIGQPVAPVTGGQSLVRLEVTELSPRVVTAATGNVTVTGKVTNTSDRRIDDIRVRLQRGQAVDSDRVLRELQNQATDVSLGPFQNVSKTLERNDSADFSLTVPVAIDEPGVYPLLVNVNGRPDFGDQARLAATSIALPVLSVPGAAARPKDTPPEVTILWPLLDERPRLLPSTLGGTLLADDGLAESLTVGGRLFDLVNAVRTKAANTELLRSVCFAVDPDLLSTVSRMTEGYRVRTGDGQVVAGKGMQAATDWLARVADLTRGRCVISVPYADADLVAMYRAGAVELAQLAAISSTAVTADILDPVQPMKFVYWPAGGAFDQNTLLDLTKFGPATVLTNPGHLQRVEGSAPYAVNGSQTTNPIRAVSVDSLVSDALAGPTTVRSTINGTDTQGRSDSVQNGLAALAYRAAFDQRKGGQVLIAPPRRWQASSTELDQFLSLTGQLFDEGFATPLPLDQVVGAPEGGTADAVSYTAQDTAQEVPTQVTAHVMRVNATRRDMLDAMADDNTSDVDPAQLLEPIQYGLLRGVSTAWRGRTEAAVNTVDFTDQQLDALRDQVVVNDPGRPLSLASGDSPIPVKVYNGLPVTIVVQVNLSPVPGLRPDPIQNVRIPPLSSITRYVPAEVSRSGRFTVDVRLSTPGGTPLGSLVRLELNSTSYGIISVAVTGTAGAVLVLLVGVRIFRRVRAARAGEAKTGEEIVDA